MKGKIFIIILIVQSCILGFLLVRQQKQIEQVDQKLSLKVNAISEVLSHSQLDVLKIIDSNDIVIGHPDALKTLYVYTRHSCFFCNAFYQNQFKDLMELYVNSGELKIVIRYAVSSKNTDDIYLVQGGYYAYTKNEFIRYNDSLISKGVENVNLENFSSFYKENISNQFDFDEFKTNGISKDYLLSKSARAKAFGINRTPTFVFNDKIILGAPNIEKFQNLIENVEISDVCEN